MDERASHGRRVRTDEDADSGIGGNAGGKDHDAGSARWLRGGYHASDATIGVALIVLQLTLLVLHQDVVEEICMQSANFPPTEMLGMEGAYDSVVGVIAVFVGRGGGDRLRSIEDISSTLMTLHENPNARWWAVYLPLLFLVTNIFNIKATEATSARWHIPVLFRLFGCRNPGQDSCSGRIPVEYGHNIPDVPPFLRAGTLLLWWTGRVLHLFYVLRR